MVIHPFSLAPNAGKVLEFEQSFKLFSLVCILSDKKYLDARVCVCLSNASLTSGTGLSLSLC